MSRSAFFRTVSAGLIGVSALLGVDMTAAAQSLEQVVYQQIEDLDRHALEALRNFRYEEAQRLAQQALEAAEAHTVADRAMVAQRLDNIAFILRIQHRYDEVIPYLRRALALREELFGAESVDLCQSLTNVALLYELRKEFTDSQRILTRCLALQEDAFGANHPAVAHTLYMLAKSYRAMGRTLEADELSNRAEEILGPGHPEKLITEYESGRRERDKTFFGQISDYHWTGTRIDDEKSPTRLTLLGEATFNNGLWSPFEARMVLENETWRLKSILPISLCWKAVP